ncbi:hypothetical protein HU200_002846 [Digitaria exilis]|uniref:Lecithin-cholesterol acyltransferase-like 1 n=1 Tax=Digitaria exilis TaxID=1010633 RepID=A0A835KV33_9POAL|nr:hypothetical protein HU200_002846 [Digitaria exilis]CAB3467893.1 unnamed protein product [Digitaria exilis]
MESRQQRLIITPLVLLLLASLFFAAAGAHDDATPGLHPVILLPGYSCSQLDARLTDDYEPPTPACGVRKQGRGWFRLWENYTALQVDPALLPCFHDQLRLGYDRAAGDYRNAPGVETHVVSFGTTRSFRFDDPALKNGCMQRLAEALEGVGYKEGSNLFGAPYDFRYAPAAPGVAARSFAGFRASLKRLVERASETNGDKPVILVSHSFGAFYATQFIDRSPLPWRTRYLKHFVMLCAGGSGSPGIMQVLASTMGSSTPTRLAMFGDRSFESTLSTFPSPEVYGDTHLVVTRAKNYTAENIPEFLAAVGFSDEEVERYRRRAMPLTLSFKAPIVPMTSINGVGVPTVDKIVYWDGNFTEKPQVVNGDGDGAINLKTVQALEKLVGDDPDQRYFKSVLVPNTTHSGMISDDSALRIVVGEILEANLATSG